MSNDNKERRSILIESVIPSPMVLSSGMNETYLTLHNDGEKAVLYAKVAVMNLTPYVVNLGEVEKGTSKITLPVTDTYELLEAGKTTTLALELYDNEACSGTPIAEYKTDKWERTRHWNLFISQHMHTDLGYTLYQEDLKELFAVYLDIAKQYMKNSDERESDIEKYRYAIESSYMMYMYMQNRSADEIKEVVDLVKKNRMIIGAGLFNFTMENFSGEETARAAYFTNRFLVDKLGVKPNTVIRMIDNPSFSKSFVDIAASSGIKYGIHSMNGDRSPYRLKKQYDLFYMEGFNKDNKLLIFNNRHYDENYGFGGTHGRNIVGVDAAEESVINLMNHLMGRTGRLAYPYDIFPMPLVPFGDNQPPLEDQNIIANSLNKRWEEKGYSYPRIIADFPERFFEEVEEKYGHLIPVEQGTEENWWNDGLGTTAFESGTNKLAGNTIPVAETAAAFASLFAGEKYPYEEIYEAVLKNLIYDEHTWGNSSYDGSKQYISQYEWKRSHAFAAKTLGEELLTKSILALASKVKTEGKAVYVYNPLNFVRTDVVSICADTLPKSFEILDGKTSVPFRIENGTLTFIASNVPPLGYKTFMVKETDITPTFKQKVSAGENYIENRFYKVTFAKDGTISSIYDKVTSREIVDSGACEKFNQYRYYDDFGIPFTNMGAEFSEDKWKLYSPTEEDTVIEITSDAVAAVAKVKTSTFRAKNIVQTVTLYSDIQRIDIKNEVVKDHLPSLHSKEEAFYTFPFKADSDYEIRYDLPIGNVKEGDQVYGTSFDWYTVSKWVNVQDKKDGYNMVLAIPNSSLMQFGERRTGNWSFDYVSKKPYVYSYVMNNMWQTNFQGDQPGYADFCYSITTNTNKEMADTARFGFEINKPLCSSIIPNAQEGILSGEASYLSVTPCNVQVSTIKTAEANGEGMIIRLCETEGKDTRNVVVTLPFEVCGIYETDIIENNISEIGKGKEFCFDLKPFGVKTFRIVFGKKPETVTSVSAISSGKIERENLSVYATASASSSYYEGHLPVFARSMLESKCWASKGERDAWFELKWDSPVTISAFAIFDRPNKYDDIERAIITFSDGDSIEVKDIPNGGRRKEITLSEPKTITSLKAELFGTSYTSNIGLNALEVYDKADTIKIKGTEIKWNAVSDALYYEIFRSTDPSFLPASGNFLVAVNGTSYFDSQVTDKMKQPYYYSVRAVSAGRKGEPSKPITPTVGEIIDTTPPTAPVLYALTRENTRIDLFFTPSKDNIKLSHYEIYRDGKLIKKTEDNYVTSYRDNGLESGVTYSYTVHAVDTSGNTSVSNTVTATTFNY